MIRVSVEVSSGATCLRRAVWAENIERAVGLVGRRYPGFEARVLFPIEPEDFFAKGPTAERIQPEAPAGTVEAEVGNRESAPDVVPLAQLA